MISAPGITFAASVLRDIERPPDQVLRRLRRAESAVRRQRDVRQRRQRMPRRQRLGVEHIQRRVPQPARRAVPRSSPPRPRSRRARCSPASRPAAASPAARRRGSRASRRSAADAPTAHRSPPAACRDRRTSRPAPTSASGSTRSPACRNPTAIRATSAAMPPKPSRPSVLPVSCMPSVRTHSPRAHAAVHDRQSARRGPHQGDRVLGHRRVAVALDDVHGDAELGQFLGVHVAARAGAEEDDVLQAGAAPHHLGRHLAVVVEHEVVAGEQAGQRRRAAPRAARSPSPADRRDAPRGGTRPPDRPPHRETAPSSHPPSLARQSAQAGGSGKRALPRHVADPVSTATRCRVLPASLPSTAAASRTRARRCVASSAPRRRRFRLLGYAVIAAVWGMLALAVMLLWFARDLPRPEAALDAARRPSLDTAGPHRPRLRDLRRHRRRPAAADRHAAVPAGRRGRGRGSAFLAPSRHRSDRPCARRLGQPHQRATWCRAARPSPSRSPRTCS